MMRKNIRITAKMADALGCTIEINGKQAMIMSHPKTQAALAARGLADEHGYLTDSGRYVAYLIGNGSKRRTWAPEQLADETAKWVTGRKRDAERVREMDEYAQASRAIMSLIPNGRNAARDLPTEPATNPQAAQEPQPEDPTVECECGAMWLTGVMGPGHNDMDCTLASQRMRAQSEPKANMRVEIRYADGTTEEVKNIPTGTIAAGIYAEATMNDRVTGATLYRSDGSEARVYTNTVKGDRHVVTERIGLARTEPRCGRRGSRSVARSNGLEELPVCVRTPDHLGLHRNVRTMPRRYSATPYVAWGDNECLPDRCGKPYDYGLNAGVCSQDPGHRGRHWDLTQGPDCG